MAQATQHYNRFHNLSDEVLADAIGHADAVLKGAEAECKTLKEEFKSRGLLTAAGEHFTITRSRPDQWPARRSRREATSGRRVAQVRDDHHQHRDPHQGRSAARRGVTRASEIHATDEFNLSRRLSPSNTPRTIDS